MKTYPLTAAQNMHNLWIHEYGTQQVSGISIVAALQAPLEFGLLEKSIRLEYERSGCLRLRFTRPDKNGTVKQYIAPVPEKPEPLELVELQNLSAEEANSVMQNWAYETFDGDNRPMCEFRLVKLPNGYNGFFVHMDHRLIDSAGFAVIVGDVFRLYSHFAFGTEMPKPPADFKTVLLHDLERASNERRFAKDQKFWNDQLDALGEPLYSDIQGPSVLEAARIRHNDPTLRAADIERKRLFVDVSDYYLEQEPSLRLIRFCENHQISMTNLLLLALRTYLSKVNNGQEDITVENFISRRSTRDEWSSGGSRTLTFPCRTVIPPDMEFIEAAYEIQRVQNQIYMHGSYDPELIREEMRRRYGTPKDTTYVSCYLTYQPVSSVTGTSSMRGIPLYVKWFANGAATKKMYLTVSHAGSGEMKFSYHYQTAELTGHDMELLYYYMMRILFTGIADPHMTVGELMARI